MLVANQSGGNVIVFQIDQEGTILMVNRSGLSRFGYTEEEMLGHNIKMICGGSHANSHDQYLRKYIRTGINKISGTTTAQVFVRQLIALLPAHLSICRKYTSDWQVP